MLAGDVEAWRARRIAQAVLGRPDDVCDFLDDRLAPVAGKVGPVTLDRLLDEAMLRLHAEERELAQIAALDARYVRLDEGSINDAGVADLHVRGDWKDLHDFDQAVSAIARALADREDADPSAPGHCDTFETRRSRAVGILADPAQARALLEDTPAPAQAKRAHLIWHLSEEAVTGSDPVGRDAALGRPVLAETIRAWCGRTDTHLTVTPVIDLTEHVTVDRYEAGDRLEDRLPLRQPACVFPWCTRPARRCDCDHVVAYAADGATCDCNLASALPEASPPETHAGWRYTTLETGVWLCSDPNGQQFLRDHEGTRDVTPPDRPVNNRHGPSTGCRASPEPRGRLTPGSATAN